MNRPMWIQSESDCASSPCSAFLQSAARSTCGASARCCAAECETSLARGLAVDLHVLQYGVTRERLRDVLEQGEGWDVIHFSGHGMPGALVLERDAADAFDKIGRDIAAGAVAAQRYRADTDKRAANRRLALSHISLAAA